MNRYLNIGGQLYDFSSREGQEAGMARRAQLQEEANRQHWANQRPEDDPLNLGSFQGWLPRGGGFVPTPNRRPPPPPSSFIGNTALPPLSPYRALPPLPTAPVSAMSWNPTMDMGGGSMGGGYPLRQKNIDINWNDYLGN